MPQWIKNIVSSPKSTLTAIGLLGTLVAAEASQFPTAKWLGISATAIAIAVKALSTD